MFRLTGNSRSKPRSLAIPTAIAPEKGRFALEIGARQAAIHYASSSPGGGWGATWCRPWPEFPDDRVAPKNGQATPRTTASASSCPDAILLFAPNIVCVHFYRGRLVPELLPVVLSAYPLPRLDAGVHTCKCVVLSKCILEGLQL
jgi:hypothetical protein